MPFELSKGTSVVQSQYTKAYSLRILRTFINFKAYVYYFNNDFIIKLCMKHSKSVSISIFNLIGSLNKRNVTVKRPIKWLLASGPTMYCLNALWWVYFINEVFIPTSSCNLPFIHVHLNCLLFSNSLIRILNWNKTKPQFSITSIQIQGQL